MNEAAQSISFSRKRQFSHEFRLLEANDVFVSVLVRTFDPESGRTEYKDDRLLCKMYAHELQTQFPYLTRSQSEKLAKFLKPQVPQHLHFLYGIES